MDDHQALAKITDPLEEALGIIEDAFRRDERVGDHTYLTNPCELCQTVHKAATVLSKSADISYTKAVRNLHAGWELRRKSKRIGRTLSGDDSQ